MLSNIGRHLYSSCSFLVLLSFLFLPGLAFAKENSKVRNLEFARTSNNLNLQTKYNNLKSSHLDSVSCDSVKFASLISNIDSTFQTSPSKGIRLSRNPFSVSQTINNHSKDITSSYHSYLKIDPAIRGKIIVRILVNHAGSVHDVQIIESSLNSKTFESSVISQIKTWNDFTSISNNVICAYRQEFQFGE